MLIIIVIASYFVKPISDEGRLVPISGTDNYYFIDSIKHDTIVVNKKYLSQETLLFIKLGFYD